MAVAKSSLSDDQLGFLQKANELSEAAKPLPWYKSYANTAIKGTVKGLIGLNRMMTGGPRPDPVGEKYMGKISPEQQAEDLDTTLDEYLPNNQGTAENVIGKGTEMFPSLAAGGFSPGSAAIRSGLAAGSSELAKEVGLGETGQALAELPALLGPELGKKIPFKAGSTDAKLADWARKNGVTEEELALMHGQRGKVDAALSNVAPKGGQTKKAFDAAKDKLNTFWQGLTNSPDAAIPLGPVDANTFFNEVSNKISQMPAEQRKRITQDFNDLLNSQMTGKDLINFWQDLNYYIPKGETKLGVLKEDISKALSKISPGLGDDFQNMNQLYGNYSRIRDQMTPSIVDKFYRLGEAAGLVGGLMSGNIPAISAVVGAVASRELARQMIINPRLQNLSQRFINAAQRSTPAMAKSAFNQFVLEIAKTDAETAAKISEFDAEEFARSLRGQKDESDK